MTDMREDQKSPNKCTKNLATAQITAISHVLYTKPTKTQFLEVECKNKIYHIAVSQEKILQLTRNLSIGGMYNITNLSWKQMIHRSDGSIKKVCMTTSKTTFVNLESVRIMSPSSTDLVNYEGLVTAEICAPLRIYELDDTVELYIGYLTHLAKMKIPKIGQRVSVYNAHWEIHNNKPCLILCGRGYIKVPDEIAKTKYGRCDFTSVMGKMTYSRTLWLRRQLSSFEQKFTTTLLRANNIMSDSALQLLQKCIEVHHPNSMGQTTLLSKEFISHPHCCGILDEEEEYPDYETLEKFCDVHLKSEKLWSYHKVQCEGCAVGVLTASVDSGYWVLSDATHSISCLITGSVNENLHGALVLLTECSLFVELFRHGKSEYYIHAEMKHVKIVQLPDIHWKTKLKNGCKKLNISENWKESCEEELDLLHQSVMTSRERSLLILVHHKTATMKNNEKTFCCLVVSRINKANQIGDGMCSLTERFYLLLDGKLVQYIPLLHNNMMYKLVFSHTDKSFSCKYRLKQICSTLPDVMGFRLHENCFICSADSGDVAFLTSITDCYSVGNKELYEDLEPKELVNIEGVICDRLHIDSIFNSEKHQCNIARFGIPDEKTVVLKLNDPSLQNECVVSLYLNKWSDRVYPLGLIPGARIQAMFVTMVKSQNSANMYFKVTDLTRLHVVEVVGSINASTLTGPGIGLHQWGPSCILTLEAAKAAPGSLLWGLIRGAKIINFTASVSCAKCSMSFKRGICTGCKSFPSSPKLTATAKCYISDVIGQIIIFIKGDLLLTFFGVRKPYWNVIARLVSLDGNNIILPETHLNSEDPPGKKLLQALIDVSNQKKRHFYVFCRQMKLYQNDPGKIPKLYCLDIQVPNAHLLYRSLQNS